LSTLLIKFKIMIKMALIKHIQARVTRDSFKLTSKTFF
jgi:hypothetical protein